MIRFPRYRQGGFGLVFSAFAVFMIVSAAKSMFPLDLGDGPLWTKILVVVFLICWYGLLVLFALCGLSSLQAIEMDHEEIRACFGSIVVRRIPLAQIKSVGISAQYGRHGIIGREMVLSEKDRHELNEIGVKYLKRRRVCKWMKRAGVSAEGADAAARACLFESRKGVLLRMEWTVEAEATLRKYLSAARFLW